MGSGAKLKLYCTPDCETTHTEIARLREQLAKARNERDVFERAAVQAQDEAERFRRGIAVFLFGCPNARADGVHRIGRLEVEGLRALLDTTDICDVYEVADVDGDRKG